MSLPNNIAEYLEAVPDSRARYAIRRVLDATVVGQDVLNQYAVGASSPQIYPAQGSVINPTAGVVEGTFLERLPGWSYTPLAAGGYVKVNSAGGLDFATTGQDRMYLYNTGVSSYYIEATFNIATGTSFPLCIAAVDSANFLGVRLQNSGTLNVYQKVGGTFTSLYNIAAGGGGALGSVLRLEKRASGSWHLYYAGTELPNGFTGSVSGTTLTIASVKGGSMLGVGAQLRIPGQPPVSVTALGTGTGGVGTYTISANLGTVASGPLQTVIPTALASSTSVGILNRVGDSPTGVLSGVQIYSGPIIHGAVTGAWTWFTNPRAVTVTDSNGVLKTFFCSTAIQNIGSATGSSQISQYNHSTKQTLTYNLATGGGWGDDHGVGGILIRPDGRLVVTYCAHNEASLRLRVSVNAYDISAGFCVENVFQTVTMDADHPGFQYPCPVMLSAENNTIYVIHLNNDEGIWAIQSTDLATATAPASDGATMGTVTWSTPIEWVGNATTGANNRVQAVYFQIENNGVDTIDLAITNTDVGSLTNYNDVRHLRYKGGYLYGTAGNPITSATAYPFTASACTIAGTTLTVGGTVTGALQVGMVLQGVFGNGILPGTYIVSGSGSSWTVSKSQTVSSQAITAVFGIPQFTPIITSFAPDNAGPVWVQDIAVDYSTGVVQVVYQYADQTNSAAARHSYGYARWDGASWSKTQIPNTITASITEQHYIYAPGICLDRTKPGVVYYSVGSTTTASDMYRAITPDGGISWTSQKLSPQPISGAYYGGEAIRPIVSRGSVGGYLLYPWGSYTFYAPGTPSFVNNGYQMEIMITKT